MTAALHLRRPASSRDWGNEMRKVILQMMITLDGLIAGPNDELDWIDNDPVMGEAHFALAEGADADLIGHNVTKAWQRIGPGPRPTTTPRAMRANSANSRTACQKSSSPLGRKSARGKTVSSSW